VAVGAQGAISTSTNGLDWSQRESGVTNNLNAVCYGTNHFVAVGDGTILNSIDGSRWTLGNTSATNNLLAIAYGNGVYVGLGNCICANAIGAPIPTGFALQSQDGINWNGPHLLPITQGFGVPVAKGALAFATNVFVVFTTPDGPVLTSSDGINWTNQGAANLTGVVFGGPMTYGESGYVSASGSSILRTSPDDVNWVWRPIENLTFSVAFGNGNYVLVCDGSVIRRATPPQARAQPLLGGRVTGGGFELSMTAQPWHTYALQRCPTLANPVWSNVYTFTSTQAVTTFLDYTTTNQSASIYRITSPD
jgi:hypothetical protein